MAAAEDNRIFRPWSYPCICAFQPIVGDNRVSEKGGKLYRRVLDALAAEIGSGAHRIGTRLPAERDLAERFGVSRPTVREAMIALELQGLVEVRKGAGVFVRGTSVRGSADALDIGAFEMIEARRLLEGEVAAMAALEIRDDQLAELRELLTLMGQGDVVAAEAADRQFHILIGEASGNAVLAATVTEYWDMRERSPLAREMLSKAGSLGVANRLEEHGRILDALASRSPAEARLAMRDHLNRLIEHLLTVTETEAVERARNEVSQRRQDLARRAP